MHGRAGRTRGHAIAAVATDGHAVRTASHSRSLRRFLQRARRCRTRAAVAKRRATMTGMPDRRDEKRKNPGEAPSYTGACLCGAVEVRVTGQPVAMGYCHCDSCRRWSASPVNGFTLWKPEAVAVIRGREQLAAYQKTERSVRRFCRACGGHLFTEPPTWGVTDVYAATIPSFAFRPAVHVNYAEQVLRMIDGLPKQRDMPAEMGGSGQLLPE